MNSRFDAVRRLDSLTEAERLLGPAARQTSGRVLWHCPMHDDHDPSLGLNLAGSHNGRFHCFPCNWTGDLVDLYCWVRNISKKDALDMLVPDERPARQPDVTPKEFFRQRAWPSNVAKELEITVVRDKYERPRLRFPFRFEGQTVYWQDRALFDSKYRWLSSEGTCPYPYEVDRAFTARDGYLYVCEGISDTVSLIATWPDAPVIGIPGSSALKSGWSELFYGLELVVIADNDEAGMKLRNSLMEVHSPVRNLYVPEVFNDVTEWRCDDPESFPFQFLAAVGS